MNATGQERCDTLVHNALLLTVDAGNTVHENGAVAIRGRRIVDVGPSREVIKRHLASETIDAGGATVHPGFIDAHIHVSQYTARSVLSRMARTGMNMGDWKAVLSPQDEFASAKLAAIDYLGCGYTGFVDPGTIFEPDAVAAAAEEVGIRLWLSDPYVADRSQQLAERLKELASPDFLARWPKNTDEALARLGRELARRRDADGTVHAFIGLYGEETASPELYAAALKLARSAGVQFQEHRAYSPSAYKATERLLGMSPLRQLDDMGCLGAGTTFIHMNVVRPDEVALLADSGTAVVWCPYGQLQMLGAGEAEPRMLELFQAGVPVGLATDIPRAINFDALGALAIANAAACGSPTDGRTVLRMRTIGAAQTIGMSHQVGSIEAGKRADIVIRAAEDSGALGADAEWECAVLGLRTTPKAVIVNGETVFRDGQTLRVDRAEAARAARASVQGLLKRIEL